MHRLTSVKEKSNLLDVRRGYIVKQKASFKEKAILWMSSEEHRQKNILETEKQSFGGFLQNIAKQKTPLKHPIEISPERNHFYRIPSLTYTHMFRSL